MKQKQSPSAPWGRGVVLFPPRTPRAVRRRRIVLAAVMLVAALCLNWPLYPLVGSVFPLILGLPLSFAWAILWMLVVFGTLVWVYRGDQRGEG